MEEMLKRIENKIYGREYSFYEVCDLVSNLLAIKRLNEASNLHVTLEEKKSYITDFVDKTLKILNKR